MPALASLTALPSAVATASVSFEAASLTMPLVVLITKLSGSIIEVLDLAIFRAMAPATPTFPPSPSPVPSPPPPPPSPVPSPVP